MPSEAEVEAAEVIIRYSHVYETTHDIARAALEAAERVRRSELTFTPAQINYLAAHTPLLQMLLKKEPDDAPADPRP